MPSQDQLEAAARRRLAILGSIITSVRERQYPPTVSELSEAHGVTKKRIREDLALLVEAGYIVKDERTPRGLRITDEGRAAAGDA